jgi:hypothetical protein
MSDLRTNPEAWKRRAQETLAMAAGMTDPVAKSAMLKVAERYEELAKDAEARLQARGARIHRPAQHEEDLS